MCIHTHSHTRIYIHRYIHAEQCGTFHRTAVQSNRTSGARSKRLTHTIKSSAAQRMQLKETGESWQRIRFWRWEWKIRQVTRRGNGMQWIYCQQNERILGYLNMTYLQSKFWWKDLLLMLISLSWSHELPWETTLFPWWHFQENCAIRVWFFFFYEESLLCLYQLAILRSRDEGMIAVWWLWEGGNSTECFGYCWLHCWWKAEI